MTIQAINPATEEVIATYDEFTPAQVEALAAAHAAFVPGGTSRLPSAARACGPWRRPCATTKPAWPG